MDASNIRAPAKFHDQVPLMKHPFMRAISKMDLSSNTAMFVAIPTVPATTNQVAYFTIEDTDGYFLQKEHVNDPLAKAVHQHKDFFVGQDHELYHMLMLNHELKIWCQAQLSRIIYDEESNKPHLEYLHYRFRGDDKYVYAQFDKVLGTAPMTGEPQLRLSPRGRRPPERISEYLPPVDEQSKGKKADADSPQAEATEQAGSQFAGLAPIPD